MQSTVERTDEVPAVLDGQPLLHVVGSGRGGLSFGHSGLPWFLAFSTWWRPAKLGACNTPRSSSGCRPPPTSHGRPRPAAPLTTPLPWASASEPAGGGRQREGGPAGSSAARALS